jgi:hypothetical protein
VMMSFYNCEMSTTCGRLANIGDFFLLDEMEPSRSLRPVLFWNSLKGMLFLKEGIAGSSTGFLFKL